MHHGVEVFGARAIRKDPSVTLWQLNVVGCCVVWSCVIILAKTMISSPQQSRPGQARRPNRCRIKDERGERRGEETMRERFGKIYLSPVYSDQTVSQSSSRLFSSESFCFLLKDFQEFPVITILRRHSFFSTCLILYRWWSEGQFQSVFQLCQSLMY